MFSELLKKIGSALDQGGFPYMVIGGQAVLVYGEPRLTRDIDITLGASLDRLTELVGIAESLGLKMLVDPVEFTSRTLVLPCQDRATGIRVDFIFSWSDYEQHALKRVRRVDLSGGSVKFAALEDVIIHKIIAGRPRDLEDVRVLLIKNPRCDLSYVEKWLEEFGAALGEQFVERFRQIMRESSLEP